jgi:uncharacterized HAD superfamily protein
MSLPKQKKIRIGLDFDGVVAYNPMRVLRSLVAFVKYYIFGIKKLRFFVPKNRWVRFFWIIIHESSFFPANGVSLLRVLAKRDDIELYLITARFSFLQQSLYHWLNRYHMRGLFQSIHMNIHNEQPHIHKLQTIQQLHLDYFIEDNLDIVRYLQGKTKTNIYWIFNIGDYRVSYSHKYSNLRKALEAISLP